MRIDTNKTTSDADYQNQRERTRCLCMDGESRTTHLGQNGRGEGRDLRFGCCDCTQVSLLPKKLSLEMADTWAACNKKKAVEDFARSCDYQKSPPVTSSCWTLLAGRAHIPAIKTVDATSQASEEVSSPGSETAPTGDFSISPSRGLNVIELLWLYCNGFKIEPASWCILHLDAGSKLVF